MVLIEADLRTPQIAKRLGLDDAVGTTSVLIGQVALADALQAYGSTGLEVLACGPIPPNPAELLQSVAMEKLLGDLREQFDIVIIDAPPLLPVTDAALLAAQADGALVVVRHGKTTRDQLATPSSGWRRSTPSPSGSWSTWRRPRRPADGYGYGYGYSRRGWRPQRRVSEASAGRTSAR